MLLAENRVSESRGTKKDYEPVWVAAAKSGFVLAFEELVNRHEANIFRLALCSTQNKEDAEDVLRETFLKAYEHLHEFRGDSRFSTWLVRIAVSESLLKLRKRRPNVLSLDEATETEDDFVQGDVEDWGSIPEQRHAEGELQRIASEELSKIGPGYSIVFLLRDIEHFSAAETAQMLGLPVPAVKLCLLRARLKLRQSLDQHFRRMPSH